MTNQISEILKIAIACLNKWPGPLLLLSCMILNWFFDIQMPLMENSVLLFGAEHHFRKCRRATICISMYPNKVNIIMDSQCQFPCYCRLAVDGPFGAAATDVFQYQSSVCIAAGIGATPFASILKSIWYKCSHLSTELRLKKVGNVLFISFIPSTGFQKNLNRCSCNTCLLAIMPILLICSLGGLARETQPPGFPATPPFLSNPKTGGDVFHSV